MEFEAHDPDDPLPSGAKKAAGGRAMAMLIEHLQGENNLEAIFPENRTNI